MPAATRFFPLLLLAAWSAPALGQSREEQDPASPDVLDIVGLEPIGTEHICADGFVATEKTPPDTVLALNGGGSRAGAFGAGVLVGLQSLQEQASTDAPAELPALSDVDVVVSVSGGALAAAGLLTGEWACNDGSCASALLDVYDKRRPLVPGNPFLSTWGLAWRMGRTLGKAQQRPPTWVVQTSILPSMQRLPWVIDLPNEVAREFGVPTHAVAIQDILAASSLAPGAARPVRLDPFADVNVARGVANAVAQKVSPGPPRYLVDGALADRLGVVTGLDILSQSTAALRRLLLVDSRPNPSANRWAFTLGRGRLFRRLPMDVSLAYEWFRIGNDILLFGDLFPGAEPTPPTYPATLSALESEDFNPKAVRTFPGAVGPLSRRVRHMVEGKPTTEMDVQVRRVGPDVLVMPERWPWSDVGREACSVVAARLYTVVATQPSDLALHGPDDDEGVGHMPVAPTYPVDAWDNFAEASDRKKLLVMAGWMATMVSDPRGEAALRGDALLQRFSVDYRMDNENVGKERREEWHRCFGMPGDPRGPGDDLVAGEP